jgi:hypothetical protein
MWLQSSRCMAIACPSPVRSGGVDGDPLTCWARAMHPAIAQDAYVEKLQPVLNNLSKELPDAGYTRASLTRLLLEFLQFMEDVAGKNVSAGMPKACGAAYVHACVVSRRVHGACMGHLHGATPPMDACMQGSHKGQPKIPMQLFRDFRPDGPIFALASRIHQIKKLRECEIEFNVPARRREVRAQTQLLRRGRGPGAWDHPSCGTLSFTPSCIACMHACTRLAMIRSTSRSTSTAGESSKSLSSSSRPGSSSTPPARPRTRPSSRKSSRSWAAMWPSRQVRAWGQRRAMERHWAALQNLALPAHPPAPPPLFDFPPIRSPSPPSPLLSFSFLKARRALRTTSSPSLPAETRTMERSTSACTNSAATRRASTGGTCQTRTTSRSTGVQGSAHGSRALCLGSRTPSPLLSFHLSLSLPSSLSHNPPFLPHLHLIPA